MFTKETKHMFEILNDSSNFSSVFKIISIVTIVYEIPGNGTTVPSSHPLVQDTRLKIISIVTIVYMFRTILFISRVVGDGVLVEINQRTSLVTSS